MGKEIERKYLVQSDAWRNHVQSQEQLQQGYLSVDEERSVRVRAGQRKAFLTIKGKSVGRTRLEFEYPLPSKDARQLLEHLCLRPLITKTRHKVEANGLIWEVDEFAGENCPLVLAEIETPTDQEPAQKPEWVGKEVSHDPRYYNINLVTHPYSTWNNTTEAHDTTFHLKDGESVPQGLGRIVQEQLAFAMAQLSDTTGGLEERVHEVRKSVKRLRAMLRLMRPVLGKLYQEENATLRDIGQTLSGVRDAHALLETFDELMEKYGEETGEDHLPELRRVVVANEQEHEAAFNPEQQIPQLIERIKEIARRSASWPYEHTDIHLLANSIATTIKRGRKTYRRAYAEPTAENFHEWRKRAKDLRYQLTLLEKLWPEVFEGFSRSVKELEERLGMDHNLVVLRTMLPKQATMPKLHYEVRVLLLLMAAYQRELRTEARSLGSRIYSESPQQWTHRVEHSWSAWKEEHRTKKLQDHHPLCLDNLRRENGLSQGSG